jgi:hypothetical protein
MILEIFCEAFLRRKKIFCLRHPVLIFDQRKKVFKFHSSEKKLSLFEPIFETAVASESGPYRGYCLMKKIESKILFNSPFTLFLASPLLNNTIRNIFFSFLFSKVFLPIKIDKYLMKKCYVRRIPSQCWRPFGPEFFTQN